ncbi:MAG: FAD-dependent oxidoreductase [Chloroflexota bacterium]|nr:FAD-dependent oxidoreductase [Chloroflexota bacterium]
MAHVPAGGLTSRPTPTSLWLDTAPAPERPALAGDVEVDVAVIGAGMLGLTLATLLKDDGATVAVIEDDRVGAGTSGYTTAKVTSLHALTYASLAASFSPETARIYGEANQAGLELVSRWVAERGIDCDFRRKPAYTYAEAGQDVKDVQEEVEAARNEGLPASYTTETDLPYPVAGAIRFDDQAEFHPRKFLLALADGLVGAGSHVFEGTRARGVENGDPCRVRTETGTVLAKHVAVATHYPFLDRGLFFARVSPMRSYAIALRTPGTRPQGMYLSTDSASHSIRSAPAGEDELVIVGGEGHKTGQADAAERYRRLEEWARERFGADSVEYRWASHDNMPADNLPYVGALTPFSERIVTGTGFKKWGFTNGAAAALMLADRIGGGANPWSETFDSNRFTPKQSVAKLARENVNVGVQFFGDRVRPGDVPDIDDLAPGEGAIVRDGLQRVAASRDEAGELTVLSATCTHLYCQVRWNGAERTWDCPCHGSRFATDGKVIEGPAVKDLPRRDPPSA